jgi:hypothetical protein
MSFWSKSSEVEKCFESNASSCGTGGTGGGDDFDSVDFGGRSKDEEES